MKLEEKKLPNGWEVRKLGEVCDIIMGQSPPSSSYNYNKIGLPFFQGKAEFTELYPVVEKWCDSPNKIALPNDILLSVRAPVGTTNIANQKCCIGRGLAAIRYDNYKYVFYFLRRIEQELDKKGTGTTFRAISGETIKSTEIPIPPLTEQQAIVAKIEELFSELENGKKELLAAQAKLKTYRQSLLKSAFEGRLTNENLKDGELPKYWEVKKLGEICKINPKLPNKDQINSDLEIQFLPMKLVEEVINKISLTETRTFIEVQKGSYTPFIDEDIIFAKVTPCMENGKIAVVKNLKNGIGFGSSEFHVIRCLESILNKFVFYFLVRDKFRNEAASEMTGAVGLRRVPKQFIENYSINLPPLSEQQQIVAILESKLTICDAIEETIKTSINKCEALRQSILKKAFLGELINEKNL